MKIHELISTKILPILRGIIAHRLNSLNISQRKIAYYLEITQPMVSKILKKPIEEYYSDLGKLGLERDFVDYYINILLETILNNNYEKYLSVSFSIINQLALKTLCYSRRDLFTTCISGFYIDPNIEYYKNILFKILGIRGLEKIIPEVGSNLVYAPLPSNSISDMIGLTGRIVKVQYGVVFYGEPMYGGSRHVSKVLLEAIKYNPKLRFCINLKCNKEIKNILIDNSLRTVENGPHIREEDFWSSLSNVLKEKPNVLCDYGGLGLEPVSYVFANDHHELELIIKIIIGGLK